MLFNTKEVVKLRNGQAFRKPKPNERENRDPTTGMSLGFKEEQLQNVTQGDIAIQALDDHLQIDNKPMSDNPAEWVRHVVKRDELAKKITAAMEASDGWLILTPEQKTLIMERVSQCAGRFDGAMIGQVVMALEKAPESKPE